MFSSCIPTGRIPKCSALFGDEWGYATFEFSAGLCDEGGFDDGECKTGFEVPLDVALYVDVGSVHECVGMWGLMTRRGDRIHTVDEPDTGVIGDDA